MMIVQAIDSQGRRWFRTKDNSWQQHRSAECHFMTPMLAAKIYKSATISNRFVSPDDRMEEIEIVTIS